MFYEVNNFIRLRIIFIRKKESKVENADKLIS